MEADKSPGIATGEEVLETLTALLRSEKAADQLKAAEQLAKYHSLYTAKDEGSIPTEVIAQVEEAVRQLMEASHESAGSGAASAAE